jgi:hypothetical protein
VPMLATALRHLRNPAALARSELIRRLPQTLIAVRAATSGSPATDGAIMPLDGARLLFDAIVAALEMLRLTDDPRSGEPALQYLILNEKYVLKRTIGAIVTRHSIGEGVFFSLRRQGLRALAAQLAAQEENLRGDAGDGPT